jgi:ppGpp synthetase/RelA/SpoT-type nucleotidyltranferase
VLNDNIDALWREHPEYIRKYYDLLPMHERLCIEAEYMLKTNIENAGIEYAHITNRAKKFPSFCEKVYRKSCKDPFAEITDFSGVRIVYLYASDLEKIEKIIEREFEIIEKINKVSDQDVERFGYGALHYLIKIKKKHSGVRYDDLKDLICEIQVRTILQDAWAIVAHHLSYKHESDIPNELKRKLNALSGLFETADDQFERLRLARSQYQERIKEEISKETDISLEQDLNLDNFVAYIKWKFPDRRGSGSESAAILLAELKEYDYVRLVDIDILINKAMDAILAYEKDSPPMTGKDHNIKTVYSDVGMVRVAAQLADVKYCKGVFGEDDLKKSKKYEHLIK